MNDRTAHETLATLAAPAHPVPDRHGASLFDADPDLAAVASLYLPDDLYRHLLPHLQRMGARAGGELVIPPLQVGDVVTMTVEGLGTIENRIGPQRSPGHTVPPARRTYGPDRL